MHIVQCRIYNMTQTPSAPAARFASMADQALIVGLDTIDDLCKSATNHDDRVAMIRVRSALIAEVSVRWPNARAAVDALAPAPLNFVPMLRAALDLA
jgi:uncharacterized protein YcbX